MLLYFFQSFLYVVLQFLTILIIWKSIYTFRTLTTKSKSKKFPEPPNNEDEDEDVRAERVKVKELLSCQRHEEVTQSLLLSRVRWAVSSPSAQG